MDLDDFLRMRKLNTVAARNTCKKVWQTNVSLGTVAVVRSDEDAIVDGQFYLGKQHDG
jgi:hypothetical protein